MHCNLWPNIPLQGSAAMHCNLWPNIPVKAVPRCIAICGRTFHSKAMQWIFVTSRSTLSCARKLTVAELLAMKGKRQIVLTTAFDEWTARAAEQVFLAGGFALPEAMGEHCHDVPKCHGRPTFAHPSWE